MAALYQGERGRTLAEMRDDQECSPLWAHPRGSSPLLLNTGSSALKSWEGPQLAPPASLQAGGGGGSATGLPINDSC